MRALSDSYDRQFQYLRLSLTEVCNFRCGYCLPNGYKPSCGDAPLGESEVIHLVNAFAELGITKIRLTGGEPTIRLDIVSVVRKISKINGIKKIALTTNGYRLQELAVPLFEAGLTNLNVSVDSLCTKKFQKITGKPFLKNVMAGIEQAMSVGLPVVKINAVLLKDLNDCELPDFIEFVREAPISVRFIELMQTGNKDDYFRRHHLSPQFIEAYLRDRGWCEVPRQATDGPAIEFTHPEFLGRIGTITPYSKNFCKSCNRLRVSSRGGLQLCLFGDGQTSLRPWLQSADQKEELVRRIMQSLHFKPASHSLQEMKFGMTYNLSSIGG